METGWWVGRRVTGAVLGLGLAMALVTGAGAEEAEEEAEKPEHFELKHVFDLEWASDPQISPDGETILYVRMAMDIMKDQRRGSLWSIQPDGSEHRPVLADSNSYSSPRWSPDGGRIAYVSSHEGSPQIYVRWMDTGQTAKIADLTTPAGNLVWAPDGTKLAFTARVPATPKPLAKMPSPPKGAQWADKPIVIDRLTYRFDGAGFVPETYNHLFVVPAEGGTPRQVTEGDFNVSGAPAWLPNSSALIFSSNRSEDWEYEPVNSELYELRLADGDLKVLTDRNGPDGSPSVSPDGRYIAYVGYDDELKGFHTAKLSVLDRRTGETRVLAANLDRSARSPKWSPDNAGVYFLYDDRGVTKLALTNGDNRWTDLTRGLGGTSIGRPYPGASFTVAKGGLYASVVTDGNEPADLIAGRARRGAPKRLTRLNTDVLPRLNLSEATEITYSSSHDDREIQAWYLTPPGFDPSKKYPLTLEIHGGPFANYGPRFSAEGQLYAGAGHVVLFVNPRGSTSYGNEFANLIHHNYPSEDYDDLMSGIDAMIEKGFVDPERLFVTGGSGGGTLSAWIVGKTDRFKAAVVAKPVINWQSFSLTADFYNFFAKYWFGAMPWEEPDAYWKRSPLSLVGNVTTPTMLLTGEADYRTPMSETEQYYQALKLRKIDTAMVRIPGASHLIARRPSQLMAKVAHVLAWFDRYDPVKIAERDEAKQKDL